MKVLLNAEPVFEGVEAVGKQRIDYIVIDEDEFLQQKDFTLAFRGDDRVPDKIFKTGFSFRECPIVRYEALLNSNGITLTPSSGNMMASEKVKKILGRPEILGKDAKEPERPVPYCVEASEVVFRVHDFDLVPRTCTSLTLDFETASQFPYCLDNEKTATIFIYLVLMVDVNWLPTYTIQKAAFREGLDKCREITCKTVKQNNVLGAIKIKRTKNGIGANCTVNFNMEELIPNSLSNPYSQNDLLKILQANFPATFPDNLTSENYKSTKYKYSCKVGGQVAESPNNMLRKALETLKSCVKPDCSIQHLLNQIPAHIEDVKVKVFSDGMCIRSPKKLMDF